MRYTALFLVALVAVAACTSPADAVVNKIDSLSKAAQTEQSQQAKLYASQHARCVAERQFRNKEIADGSVAKGAADQQLTLCSTELPIAQAALKASVAERQQSQAQLGAVNNEHDIFESVNVARHEEYDQIIASIQGAYQIIAEFKQGKNALNGGKVFVEITNKINSAFKIALKHRLHKHMVPVMQNLVQLTGTPATQVSSDALGKVVSLLRELETNVKASEVERSKEYAQYQTKFQAQVTLLKQQIKQLSQIIKRFTSYISNLKACVASETKVSAEAAAKIERNSNILTATVKMCEAYDVKFKTQSKQRAEYVKLMAQLRTFVVAQISHFKSGLYANKDYTHQL